MTASPSLLTAYTAEYAPQGPAETTLVRRLATLTTRMDLLARAFDALPTLCEPLAMAEYRAEQFDLRIPFSPAPHDENEANSPAADPANPTDLAAYSLVYALTSPRAALLLRHENAADRRFIATLHELQRLQDARPRTSPSQPGIPAHLQAISDLLDRGWQLLPPTATSPSQNEPNPEPSPTQAHLTHAPFENEPNPIPAPAMASLPAITPMRENEPNLSGPLTLDAPLPQMQNALPGAAWRPAADGSSAGYASVEDEVAALQALARQIAARQPVSP